jgi:ribosome biogenesis GTPase
MMRLLCLLTSNISSLCAQDIDRWKEKLAEWGYEPLLCSVSTLSGIAPIMGLLKDKISVVVGPSGVGKSSLINALRDDGGVDLWHENKAIEHLQSLAPEESEEDVEFIIPQEVAEDHEKFEALQVSEVSLRSGKGRHTTRHVSLLRLPGGDGLLADTPGFSQPSLAKVMSATLGELFPEVQHSFPCAFTISSFKIR